MIRVLVHLVLALFMTLPDDSSSPLLVCVFGCLAVACKDAEFYQLGFGLEVGPLYLTIDLRVHASPLHLPPQRMPLCW